MSKSLGELLFPHFLEATVHLAFTWANPDFAKASVKLDDHTTKHVRHEPHVALATLMKEHVVPLAAKVLIHHHPSYPLFTTTPPPPLATPSTRPIIVHPLPALSLHTTFRHTHASDLPRRSLRTTAGDGADAGAGARAGGPRGGRRVRRRVRRAAAARGLPWRHSMVKVAVLART